MKIGGTDYQFIEFISSVWLDYQLLVPWAMDADYSYDKELAKLTNEVHEGQSFCTCLSHSL